MTVFNIATDVNAVITTDSNSPPLVRVSNLGDLTVNSSNNPREGMELITEVYTIDLNSKDANYITLVGANPDRASLFIHNVNKSLTALIKLTGDNENVGNILLSPLGTLMFNDYTLPWRLSVQGISNSTTGFQITVIDSYWFPTQV